MPFRFRRRIRVAPGVTLNVSKAGPSSVRVGRRGAGVTVGKRKPRATVGIPGTGASYTTGCALPLGIVLAATVLAWH